MQPWLCLLGALSPWPKAQLKPSSCKPQSDPSKGACFGKQVILMQAHIITSQKTSSIRWQQRQGAACHKSTRASTCFSRCRASLNEDEVIAAVQGLAPACSGGAACALPSCCQAAKGVGGSSGLLCLASSFLAGLPASRCALCALGNKVAQQCSISMGLPQEWHHALL